MLNDMIKLSFVKEKSFIIDTSSTLTVKVKRLK